MAKTDQNLHKMEVTFYYICCPTCHGEGVIPAHFLDAPPVRCPTCHGRKEIPNPALNRESAPSDREKRLEAALEKIQSDLRTKLLCHQAENHMQLFLTGLADYARAALADAAPEDRDA